jgi:hypothetical protein
MLRVQVVQNAEDSWHLLRHRALFEAHGVRVIDEGEGAPDLILTDFNRCIRSSQLDFAADVHSRYSFSRQSWDRVNRLADRGTPFILCLRLPTAERVGLERLPDRAAASPALLGTIQNRVLRPGAADLPTLRGVTHYHRIHEDYLRLRAAGRVPPDPALEQEVREYQTDPLYARPTYLPESRARQCIWDLQRSFLSDNCQPFRTKDLDLARPRGLDVFCSMDFGGGKQPGNTDPMRDRRLYTWHRQLALHRIRSLASRFRVKCGRKVSTGPAYVQDTLDARICVSPWGFGAYCIRDFEAILAGAVLVKPDTSFVLSHPDIFSEACYIPCRSDYADLEDKVARILATYDQLTPLRDHARRLILQASTPHSVVATFCHTIKTLHTQGPRQI